MMGPPAPTQEQRAAISPEVKSAVDTLLNLWNAGNSSGSHQGVIRSHSRLLPDDPVKNIPTNTSGASDQERLNYAMTILKTGETAQGVFSSKGLKAWNNATAPLIAAYPPAANTQWVSTDGAEVIDGRWEQIAPQLGFKGAIYTKELVDVPFRFDEYGYPIGGGGQELQQVYSPEFKKFVGDARAQGYDFVQHGDNPVNFNQRFGFRLPSGEVVGQTSVRGDQDIRDLGKQLVSMAGMVLPFIGGPLAASIGASILPASAAASIGSAIGASASAVTTAVGQAALQSGLTALGGGDTQDVIRAGVTGLVSQAVPSVVKDVIPPSLGPLESVAEKALTSAAMSGISGQGSPGAAVLGSLVGSAAGAIPGAGNVPPGVVQGALELASTGKVSLSTALNAAIGASQAYEAQKTQEQIDKAYSDPTRKLDVPQPSPNIRAELDSILGAPSDAGTLVAGPMDFSAPDRSAQKTQLADYIRQQAASGAQGFKVGPGGVLEVQDFDRGLTHRFTSDGSALGSAESVFASKSGRQLSTSPEVKSFLADSYVQSLFQGGQGAAGGDGRYLVPEVTGEGSGGQATGYTPEQAAQWDREDEEERAAEELLQVNPPVTLPVDQPPVVEPVPTYQPEPPPTRVDTSSDYGQSVFDEIDRTLAEQARQRQEQELQRQEEARQQFEAQRQQEMLLEQQRQEQEAARQAEERLQAQEARRQQEEQQALMEQTRRQEELRAQQQEAQRWQEEQARLYEEARLAEQQEQQRQQALEYQRQEAEREYERLAEREAQEAAVRAQQAQVTPEPVQLPSAVVPEPAEPQLPSVPQELAPEPPVVVPEEPYQPEILPVEPPAPPIEGLPEEPAVIEPPPVVPPELPPVQEPAPPPFEPPEELPFEPLPEPPVEPSVMPVEPPPVQPPVQPPAQQPSGLDLEEVRQIVSEALLINPSLTGQQVRDIVSEVMGTLPPGLTPQDVADVVDIAIGRLPQGPTAADMDAAIRGAVGGVETGLTGQIGGLRQEVQEQFDMLSDAQQAEVARRVQQGEDLNRAISDVQTSLAGTISGVESGLTGQIGGLRQEVQEQYDMLSERQQAEVAQRVQQGQDLTKAISDVQSGLAGTIAGVEAGLTGQIGGLRQDVAEQFQMLSDAQQAEVQRRINQGENLEAAINAVSSGLGERLTGVEAGLTQKIGGVEERLNDRIGELVSQGVDFQTATNQALREVTGGLESLSQQQVEQAQTTQQAIGGVESRLTDRIDQLMQQGVDWQTAAEQAIAELSGSVTGLAEQTQSSISGLGLDIQSQIEEMQREQALADAAAQEMYTQEQERNRLANEAAVARAVAQAAQQAEQQRAAQAAQAAEASRRQGLMGLASSFAAQGAAQPAADAYKATFLKPYIVGGTAPEKFEGPLSGFLKQAMTGDFLPDKPQDQPRQSEDQQMGADQFFSGSNPLDMYQPEQEYQGLFGFRAGGMVPFMAQGGTRYGHNAHGALRVLEHSGKHRVDYRQGDAVTGIGDGQSDDIPAMLADGEFVIPADVVAALGNGSTKAGSDKLYEMMHNIRRHHRSTGPKDLPPPAKAPLEYIKSRKGRSA